MKLTDLDAHWVSDAGRRGQGVTFLCPCAKCLANPAQQTRLGVSFINPVDGGAPMSPVAANGYQWRRKGETLETLTVLPSIDVSAAGHWHGFITDGEIT